MFLEVTQKTQSIQEKNDELNFIQIKNAYFVQDITKKIKRQATNWEILFANHIYNKLPISRLYDKLSKFNSKKT